ncbi:MAG TPA: sugar ABC transporter substrate-binding protein [Firmicutes bacterium]|nr:sugar ABC transporter substrate-binding protein [Bacillota bacterium]
MFIIGSKSRWLHLATVISTMALLAGLLISGCLSAAAAAEEKITLHYFTWATGASMDYIKEDFIIPFQKLHPNIEIKHEAVSFGQFFDKLVAYHVAGNPPDLMHMSVGYVYDYAQQGFLLNLQPYFDRDLKESDFFMEPMKAMRYPTMENGDLYGIPFAFVMSTFYYNKSMFAEMGVTPPPANWTWDYVREIGRKFTVDTSGDGKPDRWGFYSTYDYKLLDMIIHSYGGATLNDKFEVVLNQPAALSAINFLVDMIHKDLVAPPLSAGSANNLFTQQKLAMVVENISTLSTYRSQAKFDWDVAHMPAGPVKKVVRLWPDSFAISAKSKNIEAAWEYIKFVITQTKMDRYSGERKVPIYRQLATSKEWLELDKLPNKMILIENIPYGDPLEFRPLWGQWNDARGNALAPAWRGEISVAYAVENAANIIRNIINPPK